jgi:hypothetical protein
VKLQADAKYLHISSPLPPKTWDHFENMVWRQAILG